jgi:hypothetical protein
VIVHALGDGATVCGSYAGRGRHHLIEIGKIRLDRNDPAINCLACMTDERRKAVLDRPGNREIVRYVEQQMAARVGRLRSAIADHQREIASAGQVKVLPGYGHVAKRKHRADRRLWDLLEVPSEGGEHAR